MYELNPNPIVALDFNCLAWFDLVVLWAIGRAPPIASLGHDGRN